MKRNKLCVLCTAVLLLVLLTVPVFAQTPGSLVILNVEEPVVLYRVADADGVPTAEFALALEINLTEDKLSPDLAKSLYTYAETNTVTGQTVSPDEEGKVSYSLLEQGCYLVCSTAREGEFAPFLIRIPMTIGGKTVYDIQATPKTDGPGSDFSPVEPSPSEPNIPQTGNIQWPKYLLLILGGIAIAAGFVQILRGREKQYE